MIERITILGGSSVYTPELVLSMISKNLNVKEIVLFGQEGKKLQLVAGFCQRLINKSGFPAKIIASTDIRQAVTGAKYIINHIRVGGMQARMRDEMIPPKFEMVGDENLGAGGFANAMRTLPVLFDLARQIEEVNPGAIFINLTNPMGTVVEALVKYTSLKVYGACDLPGVYTRKVAQVLQEPMANLKFDYVGINHLGWIQDIKLDKRSCMSRLLEMLETHEEEGFDYDLIELFRMIPTRHTGTYFHRADILKKQKACSRFRSEVLHEAEQRILKLYEDEHLYEIPDLTRQRNAVWYEETILPLIEALEDKNEHNIILCVRNGGCIRDLPEDCSVELPTMVSKSGVEPQMVGSLPRFLKGLYLASKESDRLTVEAVRHKSKEYALQALAINPFVPSLETAKKYLERIVKDERIELH